MNNQNAGTSGTQNQTTPNKKRKKSPHTSLKDNKKKNNLTANSGLNQNENQKQWAAAIGIIYQVKLSMLFLYKGLCLDYDFELGTEIEGAGKLDDIVFKYKNKFRGKNYFILVQAKHTMQSDNYITFKDLFVNDDGDFGICKYYYSYRNAKKADCFKDGEIKQAIILTNRKFDMEEKVPEKYPDLKILKNMKNIIEPIDPIDEPDEFKLFKIGKDEKFYRFKVDLLLPVLKRIIIDYDYNELSNKLIDFLLNKRKLTRQTKIFKNYDHLLMTEVINSKTKRFLPNFIKGSGSDGFKRFREIFNSSLETKSFDLDSISKDANMVFNFTKEFGKSEFKDDQITKQCWPADSSVDDEDIKEFLEKFVIGTEQPNENKLNEYVQSEMKRLFSNDEMYNCLLKKITDWTVGTSSLASEESTDKRFISSDNAKEFFTNRDREINNDTFNGPIHKFQKIINEYHFHFDDSDMEMKVNEFLNSNDQILQIRSKFVNLSSIKLYQILSAISQEFIFVDFGLSNESLNSIKSFESKFLKHSLLIIHYECNFNNEEMKNRIFNTLQSNPDKKVIVITKRNNIFKEGFEEINDNNLCICDLRSLSRRLVLKNTSVQLQDHEIRLEDVINEGTDLDVDGELLSKIMKNEKIKISKFCSNLKEVQHFYINRKFFFKFDLDDDTLIIISGFEESDFYNDTKKIEIEKSLRLDSLDEDENVYFQRLREKNKNKNICLLRKNVNKILIVEKTQNFSLKSSVLLQKLKENFEKKIVLLASDSGMGKTCAFTNLSIQLKEKNPELWVHMIDLKNFSKTLKKMRGSENDKLMNFLHTAMKLNNDFDRKLFKNYLEQGKTVLFLDGFDEIYPQYKSEIVNLIKELQEVSKNNRIFISTRPIDGILNDLTETFDSSFCELQQFTKENQIDFLRKFWKVNAESEADYRVFFTFANELLSVFKENVNKDSSNFLSSALHTMMIATTFGNLFKDFFNSGLCEINDKYRQRLGESFNLSKLYKNFVKTVFQDITYAKKYNVNTAIPFFEETIKKSLDEFVIKCQLLSLKSFFEDEKLDFVFHQENKNVVEKFTSELKKIGDRFGFIINLKDDKPYFVHKSYAEYFVAEYIFENVNENERIRKEILIFFLKEVLREGSEMISIFINDMILSDVDKQLVVWKCDMIKDESGEKLHFVLKNECWNIARILIENEINITYINSNNETVFHLGYESKSNRNEELYVMKLLLNKIKDTSETNKEILLKKTNVNKLTPLLIAVRNKNMISVKDLIEALKVLGIFRKDIESKNNENENILHLALSNKNSNVFESIICELKNYSDVLKALLQSKNIQGFDPLLFATLSGNVVNVKCLVSTLKEIELFRDIVMDSKDALNNNILNLAAANENFEVLKFYMDELDDVGRSCGIQKYYELLQNKGSEGRTPLLSATFEGNIINFKQIINILGKLNILEDEINSQDSDNNNILHFAISNRNDEVFEFIMENLKAHPDLLKKLIQSKGEHGRTPLMYAAVDGNDEKFKNMMQSIHSLEILESSMKSESDNKNNALQLAIINQNDDIVKYILDDLKKYPELMKTMILSKGSENVTPFLSAVYNGNLKCFQWIFNALEDCEVLELALVHQDDFKNSILHFAAVADKSDILEIILNYLKEHPDLLEESIGLKDTNGITPLLHAARYGRFKNFESLFEALRNSKLLEEAVQVRSSYDDCILHLASTNVGNEILELTVDYFKARPEQLTRLIQTKGSESLTPLLYATRFANLENFGCIFETLHSLGTFRNAIQSLDDHGNCILHLAVANVNSDILESIVNYLKRNDRGLLQWLIRVKGFEGRTPLLYAARLGNIANLKCILDALKELNLFDQEIQSKDQYRGNVLHLSAANETSKVYENDIQLKHCYKRTVSNLNSANDNNKAFEFVVQHLKNFPDLLKKLIQTKGFEGRTPLLYAACLGNVTNLECIFNTLRELEIFESAVQAEDDHGGCILHLATRNEKRRILEFIVDYLKDYPDLLKKLLLKKGFEGRNSLIYAARISKAVNFKCIFRSLQTLDIFEDVIKSLDRQVENILHVAAIDNNNEVLEFIIDSLKTDTNLLKSLIQMKGVEGQSPLLRSVFQSNVDILKCIFDALRDLEILESEIVSLDQFKNCILHLAVCNENTKVSDFIVNYLKTKPELLLKLNLMKDNKGQIPILFATQLGNIAYLESMFNALNELNLYENVIKSQDSNMNCILHIAVVSDNSETLKFILNYFRNYAYLLKELIEIEGYGGQTPLLFASRFSNITNFTFMLYFLNEFEILEDAMQSQDHDKCNILHLASSNKDSEVLELIMNCFSGNLDVLKKLIDTKGYEGRTPLLRSARFSTFGNFSCIFGKLRELQLVENAILPVDKHGNCILHLAAANHSSEILELVADYLNSNQELFKLLIQLKGFENRTPLLHAARLGNIANFKCILKALQLLNIYDSAIKFQAAYNECIIHLAILNDNSEMIEFIIDHLKSDSDLLTSLILIKGYEGRTPLLYAARQSNVDTFKCIFRALQDLHLLQNAILHRADNDESVLHLAALNEHKEILELVTNYLKTDVGLLKSLIQTKAFEDRTPFMYAIHQGSFENFKFILNYLKELKFFENEVRLCDSNLNNVLHLADYNKDKNIFKFIINELRGYPEIFQELIQGKNKAGKRFMIKVIQNDQK